MKKLKEKDLEQDDVTLDILQPDAVFNTMISGLVKTW